MPIRTLEGKWTITEDRAAGTYSHGYLMLEKRHGTEGRATYRSLDLSSQGAISGKFLHGSTVFRGTCEGSNEKAQIKLEPDGNTVTVSFASSGNWKAQRADGRRNLTQKLSTNAFYKNKDVFERLTAPKPSMAEQRRKILEESISKEDSPEYIFTGYTHRTLAVGQEYDDTALRRQMKMSRYDGKQMLSNKHVESGQIVEHMPEPYQSKVDLGRKLKKEAKRAATTPKDHRERPAFRPSSAFSAASRERPNADMYLVLDPSDVKASDTESKVPRKKYQQNDENRIPIKVNPVKEGTFGYPGTLFGERPDSPTRSVHEYVHSDYEYEQRTLRKHFQRESTQDKEPFFSRVSRGNHKQLSNLDKQVYLSSTEDRPSTAPAATRENPNNVEQNRPSSASKEDRPAFFPRVSGSLIGKEFPYVSDPITETRWTLRRNKQPDGMPAFRPSSGYKSNFSETVSFRRANLE